MQTFLFFLQGIPEIAGIIACSLALARVQLRWRVILAMAAVLTVVIYLVRSLPVTFGLHTVVAILLCSLFIARATRVSTSISFMVSFAGYALLALLEIALFELIGNIIHMEVGQLLLNDYTKMLVGLLQAMIMVGIAMLILKYRKPVEGMWKL